MRRTVQDDKNTPQGVKVFIARQPIFDRDKKVFAYELLYRSDLENRAIITNDEYATLKVIANGLLIGLQRLTEGKRAFINFDKRLLMAQIPLLFPKNALGVEILETVEPEEYVIKMCTRIKHSGYLMILDNFIFRENYRPFIQLADIIKVDFLATTKEDRRDILKNVDAANVFFLASKVETKEDFEEAYNIGYSFFQGYFFQEPSLISRQEMPGYKANYLNVLRKIYDPLFEVNEIEEIVKRDVSLTYKLLRFINSAAHGFKVSIRSIHHALILLGKRELKRWLTIIIMSGIGRDKPLELMITAIIRARFCELIAIEFHLKSQPADLFLMGMLSLMDTFLDRPLKEILDELPLEENIKAVLLGGSDETRDVLEMVKAFEKAQWDVFTRFAVQLNLNEEKLAVLYLDAVEWSKFLTAE